MLICVALDFAFGHGLLGAAGRSGNFMAGSNSAAVRAAGAVGGFIAKVIGHTPPGRILELGHTMHGCEDTCRKQKPCEIPDWAKGYQNMPLPPLSSAFPH
jgi:hypothetical protein